MDSSSLYALADELDSYLSDCNVNDADLVMCAFDMIYEKIVVVLREHADALLKDELRRSTEEAALAKRPCTETPDGSKQPF